jgi:hypothetical protein
VLSAETVLKDGFEQQGDWKKNIRGKGTIELVDGGAGGKCLKVTAQDGALAYYTIQLDPRRVRGKRLIIRAKVKLDDVRIGPEAYSTAKIHVAFTAGKKVRHRAQRFVGTADWHDQLLVAPIPEDAEKVVLDLGIQNGTGTAWFDDLVVDDGVAEHVPVSIRTVANTSYRDKVAGDGRGGFLDTGPMDLRSLPVGNIRLGGADFYILLPTENYGRTCVALRGRERPALPEKIETVIPVGRKASRLFFLQAAAWADPKRKSVCLICTVHYGDGKVVHVPMCEGIDVGAFEAPRDLPNWKVAWTHKQDGRTVGLGVTTWKNTRPGQAIRFIRLRTPGRGAVPVVVAVSLDPKGT